MELNLLVLQYTFLCFYEIGDAGLGFSMVGDDTFCIWYCSVISELVDVLVIVGKLASWRIQKCVILLPCAIRGSTNQMYMNFAKRVQNNEGYKVPRNTVVALSLLRNL